MKLAIDPPRLRFQNSVASIAATILGIAFLGCASNPTTLPKSRSTMPAKVKAKPKFLPIDYSEADRESQNGANMPNQKRSCQDTTYRWC